MYVCAGELMSRLSDHSGQMTSRLRSYGHEKYIMRPGPGLVATHISCVVRCKSTKFSIRIDSIWIE